MAQHAMALAWCFLSLHRPGRQDGGQKGSEGDDMDQNHGCNVEGQGGHAKDGKVAPQQGPHFGGDHAALQGVGQQEEAVGDVDVYCIQHYIIILAVWIKRYAKICTACTACRWMHGRV